MQLTRGLPPWVPLVLCTALGVSEPAAAQLAVPPELRGWEEWAVHGHESERCPWLVPGRPTDQARVCAWPGVLDLAVDEHAGRFSQRWQAAIESWVALPGSFEHWPEEVTIDGAPAPVVAHEGAPAVRIAAGAHALAGSFRWARRPQLLPLPQNVALLALSVGGARVALPQRTEAGVVLGAQTLARQDDRAEVRVFRLLDDDLPARLTTQIHLAIAGEAREIRLAGVLPAGFTPTALEGTLAARLDPDNALRVQVRPGSFALTVEARGPTPVTQVTLPARTTPWPAEEVWSFRAEDRLRVAAVEGVTAIDPAQANVPQAWRDLPAYRMGPAATLRVAERSRGLSALDGNQLQLRRSQWLDFAGGGYTVVDHLSGDMRQGWRLDLAAPYSLQSARSAPGESLLITEGAAPVLRGIELREPHVEVTAVSRLARGGATPATGWRTRFTQVAGELVLAPGFRLLAAFGPDSAPEAWLERWRLLDIFAVLLIATAAWRILGVRSALVALAAIVLTYQEGGAPTWLWLAALLAIALQRAAPEGQLRRWAAGARLAAFILLLVTLVPFVIAQARLAVYPQLEAALPEGAYALAAPGNEVAETKAVGGVAGVPPGITHGAPDRMFKRADERASLDSSVPRAPAPMLESVAVTGYRVSSAARYEPGAVVQAGPGLPAWRYHTYEYSWSGPVEENASARFLISPPWLTRLWRVAGLGLSVLLLLELAARGLPGLPGGWRIRQLSGAQALVVGLLVFALAAPARAASTPDPALIEQLRQRLLEPPKCEPDCAEVLGATVTASPERLTVMLSVGVLDAVGVALPDAGSGWSWDLVQVDGAAAGGVHRSPRGTRYVSLARGRHSVRLEGPLGGTDALSLAFPMPPRVIDVSAAGWEPGGLSERHLVSGALQLTRQHAAAGSGPSAGQQEFPPFVDIDRLFHLSHDWTIDTTVTRIAPRSAGLTVSVPLLAQEAVTTAGLRASDGHVALGLAAGQERAAFTSILPRADTLELVAAADAAHVEHWRFQVGATWHADFAGVPSVMPELNAAGWTFEYYPRPGERLRVRVTRPAPAAGGTLAYDQVQLQTAVGKRSSDSTLRLQYRSTQGGRQIVRIPPDATVTRVLSDGEPLALRPEHGELSLSALPGSHFWELDWQRPVGAALIVRSPQVAQAAPASNLVLSVRLPEDRWVLYAFGPGVGPTVLYWGELLVFIVVAWLLGRSALTPLPARDWLLLGLGLSTFSWLVLGLFAAFVALFEWRARHPAPAAPRRFRLLQVGSALLAVLAIAAVVAAVPQGLLAHPDMRIAPTPVMGAELNWFVDQAAEQLPAPAVLSVSLWWYKIAMLAWALWLSFALVRWVKWAWQVYTRDGLWRERERRAPPPAPSAPAA